MKTNFLQKSIIYICIVLGLLSSCKTAQQATSKTNKTKPQSKNEVLNEDLAKYIPEYKSSEATEVDSDVAKGVPSGELPKGDVSAQLNDMLVTMSERNMGAVSGYRILIYSGTSRLEAEEIIYVLQEDLDIYDVSMEYEQPNYKVKVGSYFSKLKAHEDHALLRKYFATAIILPERIKLSDSITRKKSAETQQEEAEEKN